MENQVQVQKNRKWDKKKVAVVAAIICCLTLLAGGTLAYFTAEETAYNVITTGRLDMTLHDEYAEEDGTNVVPDTEVSKVVYVENSGDVSFWVRIGLEKIIEAAEGVEAELEFDEYISLDIDEENWRYAEGYYYYNRALEPGESTEELFTTVYFDKAMGNEYMDAYMEINVNAEAVQSRNNGESAQEAAGWPSEETEESEEREE